MISHFLCKLNDRILVDYRLDKRPILSCINNLSYPESYAILLRNGAVMKDQSESGSDRACFVCSGPKSGISNALCVGG